jgi:hypothetical protein
MGWTEVDNNREEHLKFKDKRRKHHHFKVTVFYHDGEKFARTYIDKIRAHRFAKHQQTSPVVARTRVLQVA